jgi:hypothetical protein
MTCPDCAEQVLAGARKCRFCGYTFGGVDSQVAWEGGLMDFIVRPKPRAVSVSAIIARWGIELAAGEEARDFSICRVDGVAGYALVTDTRLVLFVASGRETTPIAWVALDSITEVEAHRGLRRRLRVVWEDDAATLDRLGRADQKRLQSLLQPAARV